MTQNLKVVALALNTEQTDFGWDDVEAAKEFPGASWMPRFRRLIISNGGDIQLTETVRSRIVKGELAPSEVGVIQIDHEPNGRWLLDQGALGITIVNGESPQAIPDFYRRLPENSRPFRFRMFFGGMLDRLDQDGENRKFYFPSYSEDERSQRIALGLDESAARFALDGRSFLTLVAANNYWRRTGFEYYRRKPRKLLLRWSRSPEGEHYRWSKRNQLHTARLRAIHHFSRRDRISLFGRRWDTHPIPVGFSRAPVLKSWRGALPGPKKVEALSRAKFNFCAENSIFPGYVTEKIFDAFIAGTVPVYFGAPDIRDFVPESSFIDGDDFKSMRELERYLDSVSLEDYRNFLASAVDFLKSEDGGKHTYESFARQMFEDVLAVDSIAT